MKRNFVIFTIGFILISLLSYPSISLAQPIPPGGKWAKKAPMPTPRSDLCASVVNNLIYAIGGRDAILQKRLATVEAYNSVTDTWKKVKDIPTLREEFTTSAVDGKIYAIGGYSTVKRGAKNIVKTLKSVEVYDPATNTWEQKADLPVARARITSSAANGKIYVIGGNTNVGGG